MRGVVSFARRWKVQGVEAAGGGKGAGSGRQSVSSVGGGTAGKGRAAGSARVRYSVNAVLGALAARYA